MGWDSVVVRQEKDSNSDGWHRTELKWLHAHHISRLWPLCVSGGPQDGCVLWSPTTCCQRQNTTCASHFTGINVKNGGKGGELITHFSVLIRWNEDAWNKVQLHQGWKQEQPCTRWNNWADIWSSWSASTFYPTFSEMYSDIMWFSSHNVISEQCFSFPFYHISVLIHILPHTYTAFIPSWSSITEPDWKVLTY